MEKGLGLRGKFNVTTFHITTFRVTNFYVTRFNVNIFRVTTFNVTKYIVLVVTASLCNKVAVYYVLKRPSGELPTVSWSEHAREPSPHAN